MYVILQLQDYSLLRGIIALFLFLAAYPLCNSFICLNLFSQQNAKNV